jgi:hypothetical protein
MSLQALIRKAKGVKPLPTDYSTTEFEALVEQGFSLVAEATRREDEPGVRERHWPSEVRADWCAREASLIRAFGKQGEFTPDGRILRKMERGTLFHHYYQNWVLGPTGQLHGAWLDLLTPLDEPAMDERGRVKATHEVRLGAMPSTELLSPVTRIHRWQYVEIRIQNELIDLSGRCDGIVRVGERFWYLEIKTIDSIEFSRMKGPKPDHVVQAGLYLYGELEKPLNLMYPKAEIAGTILLYVDANYTSRTDNERLYYVTRESAEFKELVVPMYERLVEYQEALHAERLPAPLPECIGLLCPRAKKCSVAPTCFSSSAEEQYKMRRF